MSEKVKQKKLTPRQNRALGALLVGSSQQDAAEVAGVSEQTIYRWMTKDETFSDELQRRSNQAVKDATRRLSTSLDMAVTVFQDTMQDESINQSLRLRAANYAASHALKLLEMSEVLERLESLEAALQDRQ